MTLWVTQGDEDLSQLAHPLALCSSLIYLGAGPCSPFTGQPTEEKQAIQSVCVTDEQAKDGNGMQLGASLFFCSFQTLPFLFLGMAFKEVCPSPPEQCAI